MLCFRKFAVEKNSMDKRGGAGLKVFRRKAFVLQGRKIP